jgi:hypothetical protein
MIETAIGAFLKCLNASWSAVRELEVSTAQDGLLADWAQASWEALVEGGTTGTAGPTRLVVYGDGADLHPASSRFGFPDDLPTHEVRCQPVDTNVVDRLSGKPILPIAGGYGLDRFVSLNDGWFSEKPPFDHALIKLDKGEYVVALKSLSWELARLTSELRE